MDWKEQLSTLLLGEVLTLDVRLICIRDKEKWFLKRLRAIVFNAEPTIPEQICYSSYLFVRGKMNSSEFFQLISDLTLRSSLSPEELAKLTDEEKLKKFTFQGWEVVCEFVNIYLRGHTQGNSRWGLGEYTLPSWNFDGNLQPDIQDSQEPLIAEGEHYFPKPIDGHAWYLYGKALHSANDSPPLLKSQSKMAAHTLAGLILRKKPLSFDADAGGNCSHNVPFICIHSPHKLSASRQRAKPLLNFRVNRR